MRKKVPFNLDPEVRIYNPNIIAHGESRLPLSITPSVSVQEHDLYSDDDDSITGYVDETLHIEDPLMDSDFDSDECLLSMQEEDMEDDDAWPRFGEGAVPPVLLQDWRAYSQCHSKRANSLFLASLAKFSPCFLPRGQ